MVSFRSHLAKVTRPSGILSISGGWSLPTSRLAGHRGFLASMSSVQIRILQIRNPKQIQKTENPKFKTSIVIPGSLGDSSAFSLLRIWDLFRISSFGFRISLPDWRCPAKKMWGTLSQGAKGEGRGEGKRIVRFTHASKLFCCRTSLDAGPAHENSGPNVQ